MPKPNPPQAPPHVIAFIEAVCPDAPALYAASFSEKTCLEDATSLILRYREALKKIRQFPMHPQFQEPYYIADEALKG